LSAVPAFASFTASKPMAPYQPDSKPHSITLCTNKTQAGLNYLFACTRYRYQFYAVALHAFPIAFVRFSHVFAQKQTAAFGAMPGLSLSVLLKKCL